MALHLFAEQRLAGEIELQGDPGCRYVADVVVGADVVGRSMAKPALRPAVPKPTSWASTRTISSSGKCSASWRAAARPVKPAPTTTQRAALLP